MEPHVHGAIGRQSVQPHDSDFVRLQTRDQTTDGRKQGVLLIRGACR